MELVLFLNIDEIVSSLNIKHLINQSETLSEIKSKNVQITDKVIYLCPSFRPSVRTL